MGKVAFVFPGQGSQSVGMGKAAHDSLAEARTVFEQADGALGQSLSKMCFEGPEEALRLTANTQPALLTVSVALLRALGEKPDVVAGHSLGEFSANVAAGSLDFEQAVRLVRLRGTYMQEAVPVGHGAMAAVLGGELKAIERVCHEAAGIVEPVNYNCPGQIVVAGEAAALEGALPALSAAGARVRKLPVSAPFHSSLMLPAERRLAAHLTDTPFADPRVPVFVNVDAEAVEHADGCRDALMRQVSRPVRWESSVKAMVRAGVSLFVEIGPGKVLCGMIRRIDRAVRSVSVQTPDDFASAREAIAEARA